jgi:hypothetical protein
MRIVVVLTSIEESEGAQESRVVARLVVGVEFEDGGVAGAEEAVRQLGQLAAQHVTPLAVLVHVHALLQLQERLHVVASQTTETIKYCAFQHDT